MVKEEKPKTALKSYIDCDTPKFFWLSVDFEISSSPNFIFGDLYRIVFSIEGAATGGFYHYFSSFFESFRDCKPTELYGTRINSWLVLFFKGLTDVLVKID